MKKKLSIFLILILVLTLVGCKPDDPVDEPEPDEKEEEYQGDPVGFTIHYKRNDNSYSSWGLWLWEDGKDGAVYEFEGTDDYGAYITFEFSEWSDALSSSKLGFIVRKVASWTKDYDSDRFVVFKNYKLDLSGYYQIYLKQGDGTIYTNAQGEVADIVQTLEIVQQASNFYLNFELNKDYESYTLFKGNTELVSSSTQDSDPNALIKTTKKLQYNLGQTMPNVKEEYKLEVKFAASKLTQTKYADKSKLYKTTSFANEYTYNGELGAIYERDKTTFRVWSPISSEIKLRT